MERTSTQITSAALIVKKGNPRALELAREMEDWLRLRGIATWAGMHEGGVFPADFPHVDVIFSLGGDGTFVSIARNLPDKSIPLAGVNFGQVGFLADIAPERWQESLTVLLERGMKVESRMALGYRHIRDGRILERGMVVNDVVITRGELARLVNLELYVNGAQLMLLRSDGIIVSTSTGSSGYARSSGGPLLYPSLNAYVVTAICPYLGTFPPIVLEAGTRFCMTAGHTGASLFLNLDGQEAHAMEPGDSVEVFGMPNAFRVLEQSPDAYFEKLRSVGFIQGGI